MTTKFRDVDRQHAELVKWVTKVVHSAKGSIESFDTIPLEGSKRLDPEPQRVRFQIRFLQQVDADLVQQTLNCLMNEPPPPGYDAVPSEGAGSSISASFVIDTG